MHTPLFPAFRSRLAALGRRTTHTLRQTTLAQLQQQLGDFLPPPLLSAEDEGPNSRERVFSLRLTFECFLWQMLQPKTSCREVVRQVQALFRLNGLGPVDEGDSAYVQARQRLPRERLEKALAATAQAARVRAGHSTALQGRPVKVVDGSTTQLADTFKNQQRYPQPSTQKAGCGFPVLKLAVLFCLHSGAVLEVLLGSLHHHDLRLLRGLWERLAQGDILLGDRAYPAHELAALYARRWRLELCLRDLKTTLGMDQLRCKSPDMAEKELLAYLVAHNLIRCVMAEAVAQHAVDLERISFKGTVDALRQFSAAIAQARHRKMRRQLWDDLLLNLARDLVPLRPGRREPRAVKRRPKPYPLLNQPRRQFVEISHRSRYWKGRPRNYRGLN